MPSNLVPSTFLEHFRGKGAVPGTVPLHSLRGTSQPEQPCDTNEPSGLVPARFFGLVFGHSWGTGEGPGWHPVRYLCETRKALHERHFWKTLTIAESLRIFRGYLLEITSRGKNNFSKNRNNLMRLICMLVLKGILGRVLKNNLRE